MKIHVTGASGSGTTTLGRKVSDEFNIQQFDTDDFFWTPSNPPYQFPREKKERKILLKRALNSKNDWVISGSLCGWANFAIPSFDLVLFLLVPTKIRIERLKIRETKKFGLQSLSPGGKMYENHQEFIKWASEYDAGSHQMRSKAMHEKWLKEIRCEVIRYEGNISTTTIIKDLTKRYSISSQFRC